MDDEVQLLVDILLDKKARLDERDDVAIDLRRYKDLRALEALIEVASDPKDIDIIDSCAESIGGLCVGMDIFNENSFRKMIPFAQKIVLNYILANKPELIEKSLRNKLVNELNLTNLETKR